MPCSLRSCLIRCAIGALTVSVVSCSRPPLPRGPHIVVLDSTRIIEDGSSTIGSHASFIARTASGRTFINDQVNHRILEFSASGGFLGTLGHGGPGLGQLEAPMSLGLVENDSVLAVADWNRREIVLFEVKTRSYLRSVRIPSEEIGQNWTMRGDAVQFGLGLGASALIGRWIWTSDTVVHGIGVRPKELLRYPEIVVRNGRSELAAQDSGFVAFLPTDPGLRVVGGDGREVGFIPIPKFRRVGEPEDLLRKSSGLSRAGRLKLRTSSAYGLHQLPSGDYVLAHLDKEFIGEPGVGRFGNFRLFLSIVSRDLTRACVDARVELETDVPPLPRFHGDSMFVITRKVSADDKVITMIRAFLPTTEGCDWQPLRRSPVRRNPAG